MWHARPPSYQYRSTNTHDLPLTSTEEQTRTTSLLPVHKYKHARPPSYQYRSTNTHDLPLTSTEVQILTVVTRINQRLRGSEKKKLTLHTQVPPRTWAHTVALTHTDTEAPKHTARALPSVARPHTAPAPKKEKKKNANTVTSHRRRR